MSENYSGQTTNSFVKKYGNAITTGLWIVALASHAILLPKLLRELFGKGQ